MVITNVNQVVYQGDGVTTAFPFTFRIIDATDIKLLLLDSDGTETDIMSDYYVDTTNNTVYYPPYYVDADNAVHFPEFAPGQEPPMAEQPPVLAEGQKLVIYRKLPITQEKDLGDKWPFYVIELGLDKLTMILQDIWDWLGRCLCVSKGQAYEAGDDFDPTVPLEADKVICGNANATGYDAREALMEVNGHWDGEGRQIKGVADPTSEQDAVTKKYADTRMDNNFMKLQPDGTAWEGRNLPISNVAGPALVKDAANKDYVDRILAGYSGQGDRFVFFDNVEQMQAAELVPSQVAVTQGYWDINDGGGAVYMIRDAGGDTPDGGRIIGITGTDYVAENLLIKEKGYLDIRWFGAKADGVTDCSAVLEKCIKISNDNYLMPIKIVGNFYVGQSISFTGSLCLEGIAPPSRLVLNPTNRPGTTVSYFSTLRFGSGITAFNITGIGGTTNASARMTELFIENIDFVGTSTTKLFVLDAFGAPSRLSYIKKCHIHQFDTFMEGIQSGDNFGTLIYDFDICNNDIHDISTLFNIFGVNDTKPTFGGLNIHDNCIEWCNGAELRNLHGHTRIVNNLMEGWHGNITITINSGSLEFTGNYFETNTGIIYLAGINFSNVSINVGYNFVYNSNDLVLDLGNATIKKLDWPTNRIGFRHECSFATDVIPKILRLPVSSFSEKALNRIFMLTYLPKTINTDIVAVNSAFETTIDRTKVYSSTGDAMNLSTLNGNYDTSFATTKDDLYVVSFYNPNANPVGISLLDGSGNSNGLVDYTIYYGKGFRFIIFKATRTVVEGRIRIYKRTGSTNSMMGGVTFAHIDDVTRPIKDFIAVEDNNASFI